MVKLIISRYIQPSGIMEIIPRHSNIKYDGINFGCFQQIFLVVTT